MSIQRRASEDIAGTGSSSQLQRARMALRSSMEDRSRFSSPSWEEDAKDWDMLTL